MHACVLMKTEQIPDEARETVHLFATFDGTLFQHSIQFKVLLTLDEDCLWQLTRRPERYANPGLEINGKTADYTAGEYGPALVSDYACDFIQRHRDKPFLLYYPMILTHAPYVPTPDSSDWGSKGTGGKGGKG